MKLMSQESMFSDVQLEDPDARRNSNAGLCFPDCGTVFLLTCGVIVICLTALPHLHCEYRDCRGFTPTDIHLSR